jgi:acetyl esterase/lipase
MNRILCFLFTAMLCAAADEPTSKTNANLQKILKRHPAADTNKDGILTLPEAKAFQKLRREREANRPVLKPTQTDIAYGTHARHKLDLWLTERDGPTPLLICIHGGGFRGGDKSSYQRQVNLIKRMHAAGISVASINYRYTEGGKNPLPGAMHDAARAVQYLRHNARRFNLDKTRFAATGGSAGACILMWLGFHDDLADPDNADPVKRESTRLIALAPSGGQPTISPVNFREWFGVKNLMPHPAMRAIFGLRGEGLIENWTPELTERARISSPITYLTRDDPPCYQTYGSADTPVTERTKPNEWVHHPRLGFKLKEAMDKLGIECHVQYKNGPPIPMYRGVNDFLVKKLTGK